MGDRNGIEFHQVTPARDKLHRALASGVTWLVAVAVVTAIPVNVWLWGWAL